MMGLETGESCVTLESGSETQVGSYRHTWPVIQVDRCHLGKIKDKFKDQGKVSGTFDIF